MWEWFGGLPLLAEIWLVYVFGGALLLLAVYGLDRRNSEKVNGAGGWLTFGAIMVLGAYGFPAMLLLSAAIWLYQSFF